MSTTLSLKRNEREELKTRKEIIELKEKLEFYKKALDYATLETKTNFNIRNKGLKEISDKLVYIGFEIEKDNQEMLNNYYFEFYLLGGDSIVVRNGFLEFDFLAFLLKFIEKNIARVEKISVVNEVDTIIDVENIRKYMKFSDLEYLVSLNLFDYFVESLDYEFLKLQENELRECINRYNEIRILLDLKSENESLLDSYLYIHNNKLVLRDLPTDRYIYLNHSYKIINARKKLIEMFK